MNRFKLRLSATLLVIGVSLLQPLATFAQGDPGCDPLDPACPIDGGLSLLIAAGVGIAAKKAYDSRKKDKPAEEE